MSVITEIDWWNDEEVDPDWHHGEIEREDDEDRWTCLFPGRCCMPFDHSSDECHTPEMAEEYFREQGL